MIDYSYCGIVLRLVVLLATPFVGSEGGHYVQLQLQEAQLGYGGR